MSTTLEQLGVTLAVGCGVSAVTLFLFAGALSLRITHIAPRCEARPPNVIFNPQRPQCHPDQDRGNPFLLGWVFWALSLSYHTLMMGVPGTGTRNDGITGHLLQVNLDGIVLLRFHALGMRIAIFGMFIYCCIALPVCFTARCFDAPFVTSDIASHCTSDESYNLTRYERITLANIPPLNEAHIWDSSNPMINFRLYVIVFCTYIVCWYTCYELNKEWVDLLAMRRVYYLEFNHWASRREELKTTMLEQNAEPSNHANPGEHFHDCGNPHLHRRDAWIPHPEQRDTPPNISTYSVLVEGLPKRPEQAVSKQDLEAAMSEQQQDDDTHIDWQLSVTSAFFDYCVPNQPGFSSSVAAVTILPSASELAAAWKKWYKAAAKLQRLRFIRRELFERGYGDDDREVKRSDDEVQANDDCDTSNDPKNLSPKELIIPDGHKNEDFEVYSQKTSRQIQYTNEILGDITDQDVEAMFLKSLRMGPEQTAVYSMELARGASGCCPYGCCEERVRWSSIENLLEMELDAVQHAHDAFLDLESARKKAALSHDVPAVKHGYYTRQPMLRLDTTTPQDESMETRLYGKGHETLVKANLSAHRRNGSRDSSWKSPSRGLSQSEMPRSSTKFHEEENKEARKSSSGGTPSKGVLRDEKYSPLTSPRSNGSSVTVSIKGHDPNALRAILERDRNTYFPSMARIVANPTLSKDSANVRNVNNRSSSRASAIAPNNPWETVEQVARECTMSTKSRGRRNMAEHRVSDGIWNRPSVKLMWNDFWKYTCTLFAWTVKSSGEATDLLARDSTFAVVTFTSRQAAIAARKCLADGRGTGKWRTLDDIPVPPLADASAFNICDCRGCCRPVTVTLNDHQKIWRNYLSLVLVACVYVFYTVPITWAATFGSQTASTVLPTVNWDQESLYGFIRAQLLNLFLAFCPNMFLAIANFGSNATSMVAAEYAALQYYWWFFLIFAIVGSSVAQMVLRGFEEGSLKFFDTLQNVAATIPVQVSSTWANWIILKTTITNPLFYLLQLNTFLFSCFGLKCCVRAARGGGAGCRVPYRWFVESGMVILCVLALAPVAPIVSVFASLYFIVCLPILRHVLIFTYKPQFDAGGIRWPFLFEICVSSLLVGQVLTAANMALKKAVGPAVLASFLAIPTLVFRRTTRERYLAAYKDAALLQTSLLDGWDVTTDGSATRTMQGREEFRRFLVDSHKACYVPVAIAGTNTDKILTAEPAVVVPAATDTDFAGFSSFQMPSTTPRSVSSETTSDNRENILNSQQVGAVLRRNWAVSSGGSACKSTGRTNSPSLGSDDENKALSASGSEIGTNIKVSSLGLLREDENGDIVVFEEEETHKDK